MRTERHQPDYILLIAVLMLTGIGIITVFSASAVKLLHTPNTSADHMAVRQLISAIGGLAIFGAATYFPYRKWYKWAPKCLMISIVLLGLVLIPGIGNKALGARRWLGPGSLHLQPSALAILAIVIYLSFFLTKKMPVLHDSKRSFRPAMMVILLVTLLILMEPDMGTSMALLGTAIVVLFASGLRLKPMIITLCVLMPALYALARFASYRSDRLKAFFHPFADHGQSAYQLINGLTAISRGGLTGQGFEHSIMATGYLPEAYNDFIFAAFTEQWGWLGDAALLSIFAVLVWRGFHIARYAKDRFGALLAIGLTSSIIVQAVINLCAVTWLIPVTGIPLPFISYGGTALVINLLSAGILMAVSRETGDVAMDVDMLADVVSVDSYRAERNLSGTGSQGQRTRPAQVTSLSRHRSSWRDDNAKPSREIQRRNLSLTWKAQQEASQKSPRNKR